MDEKQIYQRQYEAKLHEWDLKIDDLQSCARMTKPEVKIEYQNTIEELKRQREDVRNKLEALRSSTTADAWHNLKASLEPTNHQLETAVAKDRFR